jgi:hypothetical protein
MTAPSPTSTKPHPPARPHRRAWEAIIVLAALAVVIALGVFGPDRSQAEDLQRSATPATSQP